MTPATTKPVTAEIIKTWSGSGTIVRKLAARVAREIAILPPNTQVDSSMKIAAKYGVTNSMAVHAQQLLTGANLIYKQGRRYYTGKPEGVSHRPRTGE